MDTIANMLTLIRNAQTAGKQTVSVPYSKIKMAIAEIMAKENFIKEADHKGKKTKKTIDIVLNYGESGKPAINSIKRVSKPSRRIYVPAGKIRPVRNGLGIQILSTSGGVMTGKEAKEKKVGGEVLCEVF